MSHSNPKRLEVALGDASYPIIIGDGILASAGELLGDTIKNRHAIIIADETVAQHHLAPLKNTVAGTASKTDSITVAPGEASKSFAAFGRLMEDILALGAIDRDCVLMAFGGGVIGDLAGFAAASLLRGVDYIQIPTTLLAMVDSSVGGKTGINSRHGKNLIGAFHQPKAVIIDPATLASLASREFMAGYAEVVKYALIEDAGLLTWLEDNLAAISRRDPVSLAAVIARCCAIKARITEADERDTANIRAALNLGHTFGHAYEAIAGYDGTVLHGEAVAVGMVDAWRLATALGDTNKTDCGRIIKHLTGAGMPTSRRELGKAVADAAPEDIISVMRGDKKAKGGRIALVLPRAIGEVAVENNVSESEIIAILTPS